MARKKSIWFQIGHALERARLGAPAAQRSLAGLADRGLRDRSDDLATDDDTRKTSKRVARSRDRKHPMPSADDLVAAGIAMIVDRALGSWGKDNEPGFTRLVRAGAAGAAASLLVDLVRPLLHADAARSDLDRNTADRMLAGLGQGLLYGAVVEPRLPGPALLKGAVYGSIEYAVDPIGGLSGLLGSHTPHKKLPLVGGIFDGLDAGDRAYLEHVTFGIALALLYGSRDSSSGMRLEEEE